MHSANSVKNERSMKKAYIGIDPGFKSGAIVIVDENGHCLDTAEFMDEKKSRDDTIVLHNEQDLVNLAWHIKSLYDVVAVGIEKIHGESQDAAASMFKMGWSYGRCKMFTAIVVGDLDTRIHEPDARTWHQTLFPGANVPELDPIAAKQKESLQTIKKSIKALSKSKDKADKIKLKSLKENLKTGGLEGTVKKNDQKLRQARREFWKDTAREYAGKMDPDNLADLPKCRDGLSDAYCIAKFVQMKS